MELKLLPKHDNRSILSGQHLARVEILSQMLLSTRLGTWAKDSGHKCNWEFPVAFGPIVRLAIFELQHFQEDQGWNDLLNLFRFYLGEGTDQIMLSVFLAASMSPDLILSDIIIKDCPRITGTLASGKTAFEAFN